MRTFQGKFGDSSFIIEHSAGLVASVHFSIEITSAIEVSGSWSAQTFIDLLREAVSERDFQ